MCQISAPVSSSPQYQRTLYLFGCLQPPCWNRPDSWTCLRAQVLHQDQEDQATNTGPGQDTKVTDWLGEADDWGEDEEEEPNGNFGLEGGGESQSQSQSHNNIVVPLLQ